MYSSSCCCDKHHEQMHLGEERVYLFLHFSPSMKEVRAEFRQELKLKPWRNTTHWPAAQGALSCFQRTGSVPSTYMAVHSHLTTVPRDLTHMQATHTDTQNEHKTKVKSFPSGASLYFLTSQLLLSIPCFVLFVPFYLTYLQIPC